MNATFKNLQALIEQADQHYETSNDGQYDARTQHKAFEAYYDGCKEIAKMIEIIGSGKIDNLAAMKMAISHREVIKLIIAKMKREESEV